MPGRNIQYSAFHRQLSQLEAKAIVYILGSPCYEDVQAIALNGFLKQVMDIVYSCGSALGIFVVNAHFPEMAREIPDKQFATLTIDIEMNLAVQRDFVLNTGAEEDDISSIAKRQPEVATVKSLEMYEYLEKYDTDGEFTDHERRLLSSESDG